MALTHPHRDRPLGMLVKIYPKLSETFILEEILGLERMGFALRLYALEPATDSISHPAVQRVQAPLVRVPGTVRGHVLEFAARHARLFGTGPWRYLAAAALALRRGRPGWRDFLRAGWLAGQLREDGVSHLHTHFLSSPADVSELMGRMSGMPFSISAHAKDIYLSRHDDLRRKLKAARFTVSCTDFNCQTLSIIAPAAPVHRMYHGVDHEEFHPSRRQGRCGAPLILSVGRLREKKGLDTLIDACALLRLQGQPFECVIVGYGEAKSRLQAQIDGLGLSAHVRLVGKLPRDQVIAHYARAAVYVQPSRVAVDGDRDGIPNVLLEAMSMALPVVASRVSGIPELVGHEHNGLLVEPDSPEALASAVLQLLEDPARADTLGRIARTTVLESFDNDRNLLVLCRLLDAQPEATDQAGRDTGRKAGNPMADRLRVDER